MIIATSSHKMPCNQIDRVVNLSGKAEQKFVCSNVSLPSNTSKKLNYSGHNIWTGKYNM